MRRVKSLQKCVDVDRLGKREIHVRDGGWVDEEIELELKWELTRVGFWVRIYKWGISGKGWAHLELKIDKIKLYGENYLQYKPHV